MNGAERSGAQARLGIIVVLIWTSLPRVVMKVVFSAPQSTRKAKMALGRVGYAMGDREGSTAGSQSNKR